MRKVAAAVFCTLIGCNVLSGQFQFGSVAGLVRDASQSPVPNALVEIRSVSTNVARTMTTTATGEYNFVSLPPDQYTVRVRRPGFRDAARTVQVSVDQRVQADFMLEV